MLFRCDILGCLFAFDAFEYVFQSEEISIMERVMETCLNLCMPDC